MNLTEELRKTRKERLAVELSAPSARLDAREKQLTAPPDRDDRSTFERDYQLLEAISRQAITDEPWERTARNVARQPESGIPTAGH